MKFEILIVVIIFLFIVLLIINKIIKRKTKNNLTFIFNLWWIIWLCISFVNIGKLYPIYTFIY